jgi:hypothetical protein
MKLDFQKTNKVFALALRSIFPSFFSPEQLSIPKKGSIEHDLSLMSADLRRFNKGLQSEVAAHDLIMGDLRDHGLEHSDHPNTRGDRRALRP